MRPRCCSHPVERHAYNGCQNCGCGVRWDEHPDRELDTSTSGRETLAWRNAVVWVVLPGGVRDRMPRWKANELELVED